MHELAISESIIGILQNEASRRNFARVNKVWLEIGPFSGVEIEALRFSFGVVTKATLAESAALEIIATEARAWCLPCEKSVAIRQRFDACPECGGYQLQVTSGDEMRIKELEVE